MKSLDQSFNAIVDGPATILESNLFDDLNEYFTTDHSFDQMPISTSQIIDF